jgi:hypothetical protein
MKTEIAKCSLCGEPMPEGEIMFKFHGYSGPCPKPALRKAVLSSKIVYYFRDDTISGFWIDVEVDGKPHKNVGPFISEYQRKLAYDDLCAMLGSIGAIDAKVQ